MVALLMEKIQKPFSFISPERHDGAVTSPCMQWVKDDP
jgi:hypothetical protein